MKFEREDVVDALQVLPPKQQLEVFEKAPQFPRIDVLLTALVIQRAANREALASDRADDE